MVAWIISNAGNIVISILLLVLLALIIFKMVNDRRKGKTSCGCGCSDCAMRNHCHKNN